MQILAKGPGWSIEQTCMIEKGGCGSKLRVEKNDVYVIVLNVRGNIDNHYKYKCPVCGLENSISEKDIPANIRELKLKELRDSIDRHEKIK